MHESIDGLLESWIDVRDLEKVLTFYQEAVGVKELRRQGDPARPTGVFLPAIQLIRAESVGHHVALPSKRLESPLQDGEEPAVVVYKR